MRLIDADKFKKKIAAATFLAFWDGTVISTEKVSSFIKLLDEEETAYDVDKVVAQIEDILPFEIMGHVLMIDKSIVIEIVKSGGVADGTVK